MSSNDFICDACKDAGEVDGESCQECCEHDFDPDEGGMCLNCNREDYYNFIDEDYGADR